jgi:TolA-binding protein
MRNTPTPRWIMMLLAAALTVGMAGRSIAQTALDDSLDKHSAKRLDQMEKVVKELRAIVFQGRETGAPVVVQPAETPAQVAHLTDRLNDLDQSVAKLNGELEVIRHDLDQARQSASELRAANAALKEQVTALDQALQSLTNHVPPPPPEASAGAPAPPAAPMSATAAFAAAKAALLAGDLTAAEAGFRDYVDQHGDEPSGPEARYYLARTLLARRAWADAATADIGAIRGWPRTRWAPEAVLDLSRALIALKKPADACQTLDELARRYPKAAASEQTSAGELRAEAKCA